MQNAVGWCASVLLLVTIASQIARQWKSGSSKGVSRWLFVGQLIASVLFVVYSVMLKNYVFIVTNALMALSAMVGLAIVMVHRRRESGDE